MRAPIQLQCIFSYVILANPEVEPHAPNTYQSKLVPSDSIKSDITWDLTRKKTSYETSRVHACWKKLWDWPTFLKPPPPLTRRYLIKENVFNSGWPLTENAHTWTAGGADNLGLGVGSKAKIFPLTRLKWKYGNGLWKEYVASLIGLYKNNGVVTCVGIYFLFIQLTV